MRLRHVALPALVAAIALAPLSPALALGVPAPGPAPVPVPAGLKTLTRDTMPASWLTHAAADPSPSAPWHVGVSVAGRDPVGLARLTRDQHVKGSADYRRFLTPQEYAARFGASATDTAAVTAWLTAQGMQLSYANPEGTYLVANGTVAQVERTFKTHLGSFTGAAGTPFAHFVANTSAPTVPTAVTAVAGLDTLTVAHTRAVRPAAAAPTAFPIPASTGPRDLWSVYEQPADNTGQGQKLAAFGWGAPGSVTTDLRAFEATNHLPVMPFTVTQVGAPNTTDLSGLIEWDLDTQASSGMAPDAAGMTLYLANSGNSDLLAQAVDTWASDPSGATQGSGSYGLCDAFGWLGTFDAHEAALTKAAAEGRSFFASTGDAGSGCSAVIGLNGVLIGPIPSAEYPSTSPFAVGVGGTVLYTKGSPAKRDQEIGWTHTGGGSSTWFAAPDWQAGLTPNFTAIGRATADVAAQSGDILSGYNVVSAGAPTTVGGTSLSAPLWQGMWARVSAAAATPVGPAAPAIYALAKDPVQLAASFTDIIVGDNGLYQALPGYDYLTGWGVPRLTGLMTTLDGGTAPVAGSGGTGGTPTPTPLFTGPTPSLLPACSAYPQVTDPSGDATQIVAADTKQPAASQADLDVIKAGVFWDDAAQALVATIKLTDLTATPGKSENFRFDFTYEATKYELQAVRDANGVVSGSWSVPGLSTTSLGALPATFDNAKSTVTITLPAAVYGPKQATQPTLQPGSAISGLTVLSQRLLGATGAAVTATADNAGLTSDCAYTVSVDPIVPEVPVAALLPATGLAALGFVLYRRRRTPALA
jgi:pseudomonalisin